MEPLIAESVSRLLAKFEKAAESGRSVDVLEYFGRYTMEVILASAFGRYKDIQSVKEKDKLAEAADAIFGSTRGSSGIDGAVIVKWLCKCMQHTEKRRSYTVWRLIQYKLQNTIIMQCNISVM